MNKYLVSTADVIGYDENDNVLFEGYTMLDTSLENAISNTDVRAGQGNKLQYIYYHSNELTGSINEAQWSLAMLSLNTGATVTTGADIWTEETVTLANGVGTVTGTPLAFQTSAVYGWVTYDDVISERVVMTAGAFTIADTTKDGDVCVRYYAYDAATRHMEINAAAIPAIVRLVMRVGIYSSDAATNKVGEAIITIFKAQMTGAFTISMTPDGVSSTPLNFRALAAKTNAGGCNGTKQVYGTIDEVIYSANWYDDVVALAVVGGDFELASLATRMLDVRALPATGAAFIPPYADLTFAGTGNTVVNTAGATKGTVTGDADGGTVKVTITGKPAVDTTVVVTVPA